MTTSAGLDVLLIEDDDMDAELLQEASIGAALPWLVHHARDLREATTALHERTPRLILMDLRLTGTTSASLLLSLKAGGQHRETPVLVLAGLMTDEERQRCLDARAADVLLKPDNLQGYVDLLTAVHDRWVQPHPTP